MGTTLENYTCPVSTGKHSFRGFLVCVWGVVGCKFGKH